MSLVPATTTVTTTKMTKVSLTPHTSSELNYTGLMNRESRKDERDSCLLPTSTFASALNSALAVTSTPPSLTHLSPFTPLSPGTAASNCTKEWDAAKVPPSRFQRRAGSIYATPGTRDGQVRGPERDKAYYDKLREKVRLFDTSPLTVGEAFRQNVYGKLSNRIKLLCAGDYSLRVGGRNGLLIYPHSRVGKSFEWTSMFVTAST